MSADQAPSSILATTAAPRARPSLLVCAAACIGAAILVLVFAYTVYWHTVGEGRDFRTPYPPLLLAAWTAAWTLGAAVLLLTRVGVLSAPLPGWLLRVGPWALAAFFASFALLRLGLLLTRDGSSGDWQIDLQGPVLLLLAGLCIVVASEEPPRRHTRTRSTKA